MKRDLILTLNPYRDQNGTAPETGMRVLERAVEAIKSTRFANVHIALRVSDSDFEFFDEYLSRSGVSGTITRLDTEQKLPEVQDVLKANFAFKKITSDDPYVIFINFDIVLPYWFFDFVNQNLNAFPKGSGMVVNRRDIVRGELELDKDVNYGETKEHPGFDCMIFPRSFCEKLNLGKITVGLPPYSTLLFYLMRRHLPYVHFSTGTMITWHEGDGQLSDWVKNLESEPILTNFRRCYEALDAEFSSVDFGGIIELASESKKSWLVKSYFNWKLRSIFGLREKIAIPPGFR